MLDLTIAECKHYGFRKADLIEGSRFVCVRSANLKHGFQTGIVYTLGTGVYDLAEDEWKITLVGEDGHDTAYSINHFFMSFSTMGTRKSTSPTTFVPYDTISEEERFALRIGGKFDPSKGMQE